MSRKLEAFEMWVYRNMLRISWTDRVRNSTVLQRMCKVKRQAEEGLAGEEYHGSKTYDSGLERATNHYLEQQCQSRDNPNDCQPS
ncbi:jg13735 [Pararge aegeria aegeria]|uniref:Jg13735 protein n=1 Tax=Pararge aegeria aegeria TaxID=348720 RepID=A0A8S4RQ84_9NEOP|nr:jg13735 [Pararge aegeria aegeria]